MKKLILILMLAVGCYARSPLDTSTVLLRYGVSHEPMTRTDTVTTRMYYMSNNKFYIKPLGGGELWAAWVEEIRL